MAAVVRGATRRYSRRRHFYKLKLKTYTFNLVRSRMLRKNA
jgi:hypothetical protein